MHPVYEQARMAELVDALDSKSSDSNIVPVRFRLRVLQQTNKTLVIKTIARVFSLMSNHMVTKLGSIGNDGDHGSSGKPVEE